MSTPKAISIHLGLDAVDPRAYGGWGGLLRACEDDARAMAVLATAQGFTAHALFTADATYPRLMSALDRAAAELGAGDYLLVTFAGHGASFEDVQVATADVGIASGLGDELDRRDEAWCLYDGFLLDDELHDYLCKLPAGLRVCLVSDSCFSGTVTRADHDQATPRPRPAAARRDGAPCASDLRCAPPAIARAVHRRNYPKYAAHKAAVVATHAIAPAAHVILLAACQDDQAAREQPGAGVFTRHLLAIWDRGGFVGSHAAFVAAIAAAMPPTQQPLLHVTGALDRGFVDARPFTP